MVQFLYDRCAASIILNHNPEHVAGKEHAVLQAIPLDVRYFGLSKQLPWLFRPKIQARMDEMTGTESVKPGQGSEAHSFLRVDPRLAGQTALWNPTQGCEEGAVLAEQTNYSHGVQR